MQHFKPILQNDFKDCGICCMQWLIIYYGGYIPLEKLREDTLTDSKGTNAFQIVNTFIKWGFDAIGVLVSNIDEDLVLPVIAHLKLDNGLEHFVVIKSIINNNVYLMDPGMGNRKMTMDEFRNVFTGHLIIAKPRDSLVKMEKGLTIKKLFFKILKDEKFLIGRIILMSLIFTILTILLSFYLKVGSSIITYNKNYLKMVIIIFGIMTFLKVLCLYLKEYYENHLSNKIDVSVYPAFLKHLISLPLKNIKSRTTGEIISRINDLASLKSLFTSIFIDVLLNTLLITSSVIILIFINYKLTIILGLFMFIYLIIGIFIGKSIYQKVIENIVYGTNFNSEIVEDITNLESIKNLDIKNIILTKNEKVLSKYFWNSYKFNNFLNITNYVKDLLLEASLFVINSYGFYLVLNSKFLIIDLFTYNLVLSYATSSIKGIIDSIPRYYYLKATFSKLEEFINIEEEKEENNNLMLDGNITFNNVSFSYNHLDNILDKVNLNINKGSHVLLNGASGTGKSTICHLIYKDMDATNGEILLDGQNIKDLNMETIRNNILYVSQNEELFTGTIKENILIERNVEEKFFLDICKICEIESIVSKKSLRYNSLIEPSSKNISGGEKQRIILARGLLKRANIIILDEALSEVDKYLESKIIRNILRYFKDKTIIYISHKNQAKLFKNIIEVGNL